MLRIERQLGEIDVLAGDLTCVHRRVAGRHFDQRLRVGEALEIFVVELVLGGLERAAMALAVAAVLATISTCSGPAFLNSTRLSVRSMIGAQAGQRHRLVVDLDLAHVDEAIDEAAQPVFFQVDLGLRLHVPIQCSSADRA